MIILNYAKNRARTERYEFLSDKQLRLPPRFFRYPPARGYFSFFRGRRRERHGYVILRRGSGDEKATWFVFALLSAIFAAATSLLVKIVIKDVDSNVATSIRTCVVFVIAWLIVIFRKESRFVGQLSAKESLFLVLSGFSAGASWLCYYAIQQGAVSVVVPIDKLSIVVTVLFSLIVFKEKLSKKEWLGLALLTAGIVCMAVFT